MQRAKTNRIPGLSLIGFHRAFVLEVHLFPFPFELKVSKSKKQIFLVFDLVIMRWFHVKIQQTLQKFSSLYKAETVYERRLNIILLLQVSSHDFEPTFIILVLICRILPDQHK